MRNQSTWRFVMKIVGASLAVAGFVCLIIAYWDKLSAFFGSVCAKCKSSAECSEYDDYADELMYK